MLTMRTSAVVDCSNDDLVSDERRRLFLSVSLSVLVAVRALFEDVQVIA